MKKRKKNTQSAWDLTQTPKYVAAMRPVVEKYRRLLEEMGYDLDKDWRLCEFMVWHMMGDKDKKEVISESLLPFSECVHDEKKESHFVSDVNFLDPVARKRLRVDGEPLWQVEIPGDLVSDILEQDSDPYDIVMGACDRVYQRHPDTWITPFYHGLLCKQEDTAYVLQVMENEIHRVMEKNLFCTHVPRHPLAAVPC